MKVFIDEQVHQEIESFYQVALSLHETLTEETVMRKMQRLYQSLNSLGDYPCLYSSARVKKSWVDAGYREFICEDFHFAYQLCADEDGETFVMIVDAVHSLLNHG